MANGRTNVVDTFALQALELALNRLRLDRDPTADQIEDAVRLLDTGALDEILEHAIPPVDRPVVPQRYADVKPFSHDDWKRRHGVKD